MAKNFSNIYLVEMKKMSRWITSLSEIDRMSPCTSANILVARIKISLGKYWYWLIKICQPTTIVKSAFIWTCFACFVLMWKTFYSVRYILNKYNKTFILWTAFLSLRIAHHLSLWSCWNQRTVETQPGPDTDPWTWSPSFARWGPLLEWELVSE